MKPSPNTYTSTMLFSHLKLGDHYRRGRNIGGQRTREFVVRSCLLVTSEATTMNKSSNMTA